MSDPTLKERLSAEIKDALRAGEKVRLGALRMLSAAVTNKEKELRHELSDDEVRDVASKEMKKRAESIEAFEGAGRHELVEKERAEREAIGSYAPEQLSEDEVDVLVEEALTAIGATSEKEMGAVMRQVMGKAKGRVDGRVVQEKVRVRLQDSAS
ncbi:MAG: GatB/YqeY domain-containing protein [Actinobacteria bacterium]|nr:GatB/YqeY domain-containing protein [Actinomycetota bacterium]